MVSRSPGPDRSGHSAPRQPVGRRERLHALSRAESGIDLIYGRNAVREALRGRRAVHSVLIAQGEGGEELERDLRSWCAAFGRSIPPVGQVTASELSARLGTAEHQGMAAVVDPYTYQDSDDILRDFTLIVALDEVQDPQNLGAVIRSAEAVGAAVVIPRHRAVEVTPAVVKASAGATEHASVGQVRNLSDFLGDAKASGFWVYGAVPGADRVYTEEDYRYPTCFVLGSEGHGLGRRTTALCDVLVAVPLLGKVSSLNVSVCAALLLFEALRQRRHA